MIALDVAMYSALMLVNSEGLNRDSIRKTGLLARVFSAAAGGVSDDTEALYGRALSSVNGTMGSYTKGLTVAYARLQQLYADAANEKDSVKKAQKTKKAQAALLHFETLADFVIDNAYQIRSNTFGEGRKIRVGFEERLRAFDPMVAARYMTTKQRESLNHMEDFIDRGVDLNSIIAGEARLLELIAGDPDFSRNADQAARIQAINKQINDKIRSGDETTIIEGLQAMVDEMNRLIPAGKKIGIKDIIEPINPADPDDKSDTKSLVFTLNGEQFRLGIEARTGELAALSELPDVRRKVIAQMIAANPKLAKNPNLEKTAAFETAYLKAKQAYLIRQGIDPKLMAMSFQIGRETEERLERAGFAHGILSSYSGTTTLSAGTFESGLFAGLDIPLLRSQYYEQSNYHELLHFVHPNHLGRDSETNIIEEITNFFAQFNEGVVDYDVAKSFDAEHVFDEKFSTYLRPGEGDGGANGKKPADILAFQRHGRAAFKSIFGLKLALERILEKKGLDPKLARQLVQRILWNARSLDDLLVIQKYLVNPAALESLVDELLVGDTSRAPILTVNDDTGAITGLRTGKTPAEMASDPTEMMGVIQKAMAEGRDPKEAMDEMAKDDANIHRTIADRVVAQAAEDYKAGRTEQAQARIAHYQKQMATVSERLKDISIQKLAQDQQRRIKRLQEEEQRLEKAGVTVSARLTEIKEAITQGKKELSRLNREDVAEKQLQRRRVEGAFAAAVEARVDLGKKTRNFIHRSYRSAYIDQLEVLKGLASRISGNDDFESLGRELSKLVENAYLVFGVDGKEAVQKRLARDLKTIRQLWMDAIVEKARVFSDGGDKSAAYEFLNQELLRFFAALQTKEEREPDIDRGRFGSMVLSNPSQIELYDIANQFSVDLFTQFIGAGDSALAPLYKERYTRAAYAFLSKVAAVARKDERWFGKDEPTSFAEELAARFLQALFWEGKKDSVIRNDFIEKDLLESKDSHTSFVKDPKRINRKNDKYIAELSDAQIRLSDLKKAGTDLKYEQLLQFDSDGRAFISTGARKEGAETYGEKNAFNLHNHPTYADGSVQVVPSLSDTNRDGVLQSVIKQVLKGVVSFVKVVSESASFITHKYGITKYYQDDSIVVKDGAGNKIIDYENGKTVLYTDETGKAHNISFEEVNLIAERQVASGKSFQFDYVDPRDPTIKVHVDIQPWVELEKWEKTDLDMLHDFIPITAPASEWAVPTPAARSEKRAAPETTSISKSQTSTPQEVLDAVDFARKKGLVLNLDSALIHEVKYVGTAEDKLLTNPDTGLPAFGYWDDENSRLVLNKDKLTDYADRHKDQLGEKDALSKIIAVVLAHELGHVNFDDEARAKLVEYVGSAQIADDAEELWIGWADTRHAAELLDAVGFADLLALTDAFQNMLRNRITKTLTQSITSNMVHMDAIVNRLDAQIILLKDPTELGAAELEAHMPEWIDSDNVRSVELATLKNALTLAASKTAPENIAIVVHTGGVVPEDLARELKAAQFKGKVYMSYARGDVREAFKNLSRVDTLKIMAATVAASTQLGLTYLEASGNIQDGFEVLDLSTLMKNDAIRTFISEMQARAEVRASA
ncbi:MAG: hypothetical protein KBC91_00310 [Candidatus Omnitrophica bacterium]|nr:hypothetical protein [Candidatus Omnitrophota bacterium]